ncbi:type III restriction/modification enzyme restriction subunit [Thermodesulfitimonas autotrophica]|uniref:Type III restriction/modification enzyme restriction subunit n=1 Tax=Thermodesulfitimonas autotrophica TaxID=1894989 RepID=A0A3N5C009_9THEO|nr:DEAD/DEAH box helicase family protein [Thermodesulfitimonas autotrophica]RPF49471.1 type III restriction/modification enzyme restriction subunit [Thermodesulfitimonas autotrophica]
MPCLEDYLVLNRYMHHLLGAEDFETLKNLLRPLPEGSDANGQSHFFGRLLVQPNLRVPPDQLEEYDSRVTAYEARLRKARRNFQGFRYFQYLALLYTEIFLDRLTEDPQGFVADLNRFLQDLRQREAELSTFPDFEPDGLRRLAFFMATGSGKTLLMHVNIWQVLYYLQHSRHPEAILPGKAQGRWFDNILLITPNEGLSAQHLVELRKSGLDAALFIEDLHGRGGLFGPKVKVIEIHKLAEEPSRNGVSVVLDEIGGNNLVIVDEGHKGTGSEAQTWKSRQKRLSEGGFLLEYSATFAQAIAAAGKKTQKQLLREYGQAILFDYSYAHFYGDGYGKDFRVLNLSSKDSRPEHAHELLVGGLLAFYQQVYLYRQNTTAYRPYNIEKPLWVLLGSSVNALYTQDNKRRSDVAEVVAFLRKFVEDRVWAVSVMERILQENSGFQDSESGQDLFAPHLRYLCAEYHRGLKADEIYNRILAEVFHGSGGLEVWEIKQAEGEIGLRLSTASEVHPYFGVINIGDVSAFKKYLAEHLSIEVREDNFRGSQFGLVDVPDSPIYLLIGAKKFIEGWSSYRVSSIGLLNVGKGAGPQIIQLFGRGVRLKGKDMCLKRSAALRNETPPPGISVLETLTIFGWNANYIQSFRAILENEDLGKEFTLRVQKMAPWPTDKLPVPQRNASFNPSALTWVLDSSGPEVSLDLTPCLAALATGGQRNSVQQVVGRMHGAVQVDFSQPPYTQVVDMEALYLEALDYKQMRGYANLHITPQGVEQALKGRCRVTLLESDLRPELLQQAAARVIKTYLDRFVRMKEREAESRNAEPHYLTADDPRVLNEYRIRVKSRQLLTQIEDLLKNGPPACDDGEPLPRLYFDRSLFNPLLREGSRQWRQQVSVHPPVLNRGEQQFLKDLRSFWKEYHDTPVFRHCDLYVLRNLARVGIGLFHRSGFFPDFIFWLHDNQTGVTWVCFIDPHGLHHDGLSGSEDKFAALKSLSALSQRQEFQEKQIHLSGFILTDTPIDQIRDAGSRSKEDLEKEYPLIFQEGEYVKKILQRLRSC